MSRLPVVNLPQPLRESHQEAIGESGPTKSPFRRFSRICHSGKGRRAKQVEYLILFKSFFEKKDNSESRNLKPEGSHAGQNAFNDPL